MKDQIKKQIDEACDALASDIESKFFDSDYDEIKRKVDAGDESNESALAFMRANTRRRTLEHRISLQKKRIDALYGMLAYLTRIELLTKEIDGTVV
jgi:hypothetical protein